MKIRANDVKKSRSFCRTFRMPSKILLKRIGEMVFLRSKGRTRRKSSLTQIWSRSYAFLSGARSTRLATRALRAEVPVPSCGLTRLVSNATVCESRARRLLSLALKPEVRTHQEAAEPRTRVVADRPPRCAGTRPTEGLARRRRGRLPRHDRVRTASLPRL
jgi:hypothetical protein